MTALLLSAVGSTGWETGLYIGLVPRSNRMISGITYVALSADHLVAVELGGKSLERWLDDTTTETENKVESRFLLIAQSATIACNHL